MAARISGFLRQRRGDAAIEFIMTAAMLILVFAMLVSAMVYVTEYYSASYICRRAVRTIEVEGQYNEAAIRTLAEGLGGNALQNLRINVDASYCGGRRIQFRDEFKVTLTANYPIKILTFGGSPTQINLPIRVRLSGRSEVFWK